MSRICVIAQDPGHAGGITRMLQAFLRYAQTRGYTCDLYYPSHPIKTSRAWEGELDRTRALGVGQLTAVPVSTKVPDFLAAVRFGRRCKVPRSYDAYHVLVAWI